MEISKKYLTLLFCLFLAVASLLLAYFLNGVLLIPIIFALGTPLINIDKPFKKKFGLTLAIVIVSFSIFLMTILYIISLNIDSILLFSFLIGVHGFLFLGINGLIIESVKTNIKNSLFTFLLCGTALPLLIFLNDNYELFQVFFNEISLIYWAMLIWMIACSIGISMGIKDKKKGV